MTIAAPIVLLFALFAAGVPIGFALGVAGLFGIWLAGGPDAIVGLLALTPYRQSASYMLTTVPMFILMAEFITRGNLAKDLFNVAHKWLGHLPGGLGVAAVASSAVMGAMTGASTAAAATIGGAALPEMMRYRYEKWLAAGTVASGGTLAIMIPPSIPMVVYGVQTETSIGKLFMAGVVPGLLLALMYSIAIVMLVVRRPELAERVRPFSFQQRMGSLKSVWAALLLVVLVIGGMYLGLVTPTEAGALGAAGALAICLATRRIDLPGILTSLANTATTTGMLLIIVVGATFFAYFMTVAGVTTLVSEAVSASGLPPIVMLILFIVPIYVVLGMLMDNIPILLLTLPVTFPLILSWGYDPIWFGVLVTALGEIGLLTPPVGLAVFVVSAVSDIPLEECFKGIVPFLIADALLLAALIAFPQMALMLQ